MFGNPFRRLASAALTAACVAVALVSAAPGVRANLAPGGVPGALMTWGGGGFGQLGDGSMDNRPVPGPVPALPSGVAQVSYGREHGVALWSDGTVWTWGDNRLGQLGDGTHTTRTTPAPVAGLSGIVQISAGDEYTLALRGDGTVWAWGANDHGQVGVGTISPEVDVPTEVLTDGVTQVSAGDFHALALRAGRVIGWGQNLYHELNSDTAFDWPRPIDVPGVGAATAVAAGWSHSLAVVDGRVVQWGLQPGTFPGVVEAPTTLPGPSGVTQIAAGAGTGIALTDGGTVWTWGDNGSGELGNGTITRDPDPAPLPTPSGVAQVTATFFSMAARLADGTVLAWGSNDFGQLGDGTTNSRSVPAPIAGVTGATFLAMGTQNMAAITVPVDFSVSLSRTQATVGAGSGVTLTVSVTLLLGGPATVSLGATGVPAGVLVSFARPTVATGGQTTVTVRPLVAVPSGTYSIAVLGTAQTSIGPISHSANLTLTVTAGAAPNCSTGRTGPGPLAIPDNGTPLIGSGQIPRCVTGHPGGSLVQVIVTHPRRGDLRIELVGPDGHVYKIKPADPSDTAPNVDQIYAVPVTNKSLTSTTWSLRITDVTPGNTGSLIAWSLAL